MSKEQLPKPLVSDRTPEMQALIDAYHRQIGPAFVKALNGIAMKDQRLDVLP